MMDVSEHDNPCLILILVFVEFMLVFFSTFVHTVLLLSPDICKLFGLLLALALLTMRIFIIFNMNVLVWISLKQNQITVCSVR